MHSPLLAASASCLRSFRVADPMSSLSPLLVGLLTTDVKSATNRAKRLAVFYMVAGLFGASAFAAFIVSGGLYLAKHMSPEAAALTIAGILLSASLIVLAAASIWSARERKNRARHSIGPTLAITAAVTLLPAILSNRMAFGLFSAAVAGYVYANRKPPSRLGQSRETNSQ